MRSSIHARDRQVVGPIATAVLLCAIGAQPIGQQGGHTRDVLSVAFSPDGRWLGTASDDDTVKLWTWPELKPVATLTGHRTASVVRFSPNGKQLATSGADETVRLWDAVSHKQLRLISGVYSRGAMAFSPKGDLLAIGDGRTNSVLVVDARDLGRQYELLPSGDKADGGYVWTLAFSPNGRWIAAAGYRESIVHLFDAATRQEIWKSPRPMPVGRYMVHGAAFSPDSSLLVVAGGEGVDGNGEASLFRVPSGELVGKLVAGVRDGWVTSVDFSPDGRLVAGGVADKTVRLWDVSTLSLIGTLTGAQDDLRWVTFAPDGKGIAAGSGSGIAAWTLPER